MSIVVNQLFYDYPGKRALNDVSFTIEEQTITALVGPNGAGKSTLMRALAALISPLKGTINMAGWDVDRHPREIHNICSYLSDFFGLYDQLTVEQCLTFSAMSRGLPEPLQNHVQKTADQLQIGDKLTQKAGALSRGLRQRLAIAQAIIHQPKILLLDEPAAGLDPTARFHLSQLLRNLQKMGMTIIVSSHILAELEDYCTHMLILVEGRVVKQIPIASISMHKQSMQDIYLAVTQKSEEKKNDDTL